jgi:RHS repeat-associated protein
MGCENRLARVCRVAILAVFVGLGTSRPVAAQTGISADRVSLPEGPGSLEGVGQNVGINSNMGLMTYEIPIDLPPGHAGMTPEVPLRYSSQGGGSVAGVGWSLDLPSIERMTSRGVPHYDLDDLFAANGSEELVRIPGTDPPVYRARYEGGFVRYTWREAGTDGNEGYWTAEYPDGRIGFFGADSTGTSVPSARLSGAKGTFRYHLVEMVDPYQHVNRYSYTDLAGNVPLIQEIGYALDGTGAARFSVQFTYESREDGLSNAKPGFNELLQHRLRTIAIYSKTERIRRFSLSYQSYTDSGGMSRLMRVEQEGADGSPLPVVFDFQYSQSLSGTCVGDVCQNPYLVEMGSLGVSLAARDATLIDINGDALPDVIDSSTGTHRFFLNQLHTDGTSSFSDPYPSGIANEGGFSLRAPRVQPFDVDGDGFTDLLDSSTRSVLRNLGQGDWTEQYGLQDLGSIPNLDLEFDVDDAPGDTETVRFLDFNNDRRIDILKAAVGQTVLYQNMGESGFLAIETDTLEWSFATDNLDLADMNGDGLLDPVVVRATGGAVSYRLNMGDGHWEPKTDILIADISQADVLRLELEDINGDSLADIVIVSGSAVKYALNRNGTTFDALQTLTEVGGVPLPDRAEGVTVLFADMNANGSDDVVWVDGSGKVTYLELFPLRPNLITRIENNLGMVISVTYTTSVQEALRDANADQAWSWKLPHPMVVVHTVDTWDELTGVHDVDEYRYHSGFYDGLEKQFRGYERVEHVLSGDEFQEEGWLEETFDVGAEDAYRHGLLVTSTTTSAGRPLSIETNTYEDCQLDPIAGVAEVGLKPSVRYLCKVREETLHQEGAPEGERVVTVKETEFDGYGNATRELDKGVVSIGGGACGPCPSGGAFGVPCGDSCLGDEAYTDTDYVSPEDTGGRWLIHKPFRQRLYGREASEDYAETLTYYDGEPFEGLPLGQLSIGDVTLVTRRVNFAGDRIESERHRYDEHGHAVESISPNGSIEGSTHRELVTYDSDGLSIVQRELLLADSAGVPYSLRRVYGYDPLWNKVNSATEFILVEGGAETTPRNVHQFAYDAFGRLITMVKPGGDTLDSPTTSFIYQLGNPVSRVVARERSKVGGAVDVTLITCFDGRGRKVQERSELAAGQYQVTGFVMRNKRGAEVRKYEPYLSSSSACETSAPQGVLYTEMRYDAAHRLVQQTAPDAEIYGEASVTRTVYGPLSKRLFDAEDSDPTSSHADTPLITRSNGLGWVTSIERLFAPGASPAITRASYDEHGDLAAITDPAGHTKTQEFDLFGRVTRIDDPNSGVTTFSYDAAGNEIAHTDARGVTRRTSHDAADRVVERWDEAQRDLTLVAWQYDKTSLCPPADCANTAGRTAAITYPLTNALGGDGEGVDLFGYDERGRSVFERHLYDGVRLESRWDYDDVGRMVSRQFPDGREITFSYDGVSRLVAVPGILDSISYTATGQVSGLRHHNGVTVTQGHDALRRLSDLAISAGGSPLLSLSYTRDRMGNLRTIEDHASSTGTLSGNALFIYDAGYRLLTASLAGETGNSEVLNYAYDDADNLLSATSSLGAASAAHVGGYSYGSTRPNAAVAAGALSYEYDSAGNMVRRADLTMEWDFLGRMAETSRNGETTSRNLYGPSDQRVMHLAPGSMALHTDRDFEVRDGISAVFVRVDGARVARLESDALAPILLSDLAPAIPSGGGLTSQPDARITSGDAWLSYAAGNGILSLASEKTPSAPEVLLASSARRILMETRGEVVHLHHDHLKSIRLATDEEGELLGRRSYYPSGEVWGADDGGVGGYGFTGEELDEETGLLHFQHRYLDPGLMRWTSPDPAFQTLDTKRLLDLGEATTAYAYVANNPINTIDPTGLNGEKSAKGIAPYKHKTSLGFKARILLAKAKFQFAKYPSRTAAAAAFAKTMNAISIRYNRETAGYIAERTNRAGQTVYKVRGISGGEPSEVVLKPSQAGDVASIHTHGAFDADYHNGRFSGEDYTTDRVDGLSGYVVTPTGTLKYHVANGSVEHIVKGARSFAWDKSND